MAAKDAPASDGLAEFGAGIATFASELAISTTSMFSSGPKATERDVGTAGLPPLSEEFREAQHINARLLREEARPAAVVHETDNQYVIKTWREAKSRILHEVDDSVELSRTLHPYEFDAQPTLAPRPVMDEIGGEAEFVEMTTITCPECGQPDRVKETTKPAVQVCRKCQLRYLA